MGLASGATCIALLAFCPRLRKRGGLLVAGNPELMALPSIGGRGLGCLLTISTPGLSH